MIDFMTSTATTTTKDLKPNKNFVKEKKVTRFSVSFAVVELKFLKIKGKHLKKFVSSAFFFSFRSALPKACVKCVNKQGSQNNIGVFRLERIFC